MAIGTPQYMAPEQAEARGVDAQGRLSLGNFNPTGPFEVWVTGGQIGLQVTDSGNIGIGTATPAAKLEVRGSIKLGPTGQYFAPAGEENLQIVRGVFNGSGGITSGSGLTVTRTDVGRYTVTHNTPFVQLPAVTATALYPGGTNDYAPFVTLTRSTALSFDLEVLDNNPGWVNRTVNVIAIGPR
jgi:hypothetical protein